MSRAEKMSALHGAVAWQKRAADLCTAARGLLAMALIWLGINWGKDGIQVALFLLLVAVTLDTLDGYLARLSQSSPQTWIGAHDLFFDIVFSTGLLLYLSLASYFSPYLTALYAGVWLWLFWTQTALSNTLGVLFQAPIYASVLLAAVMDSLHLVLWMVLWAGIMLAFAGKRFFRLRLPDFVNDLSEKVFGRRYWSSEHVHDRKRLQE